MNPKISSKLEGQLRCATDVEIYTVAKILNVKIEELFEENKEKKKGAESNLNF